MKKLLSILLCCAALLPIRGFADTAQTEIDWSAMTEQEIKTVLKAGEKELKKRRKKAVKKNPLSVVSFEVKFLLDPGIVLTGDHLLADEWLQTFQIETDYTSYDVIYVETADRDFLAEGWINRLRWKNGKNKTEITYKKRYNLSGDSISCVSEALEQAAADGFDLSDDDYSFEIDWGYERMTLSVDTEAAGQHRIYESLTEFSAADAVRFIKSEMPDTEADWKETSWGISLADSARKAGPIRFLRAKGTWEETTEVTIEIWPVRQPDTGDTAYITELSFTADDYETAAAERQRLAVFLDEKGILLHHDALKTETIINAYWTAE